MANRLTIKGQVTVPKEIRDFLHLKSGGSAIEFEIEEDGRVCIRKADAGKRGREDSGRRPGADIMSLLSGVCI